MHIATKPGGFMLNTIELIELAKHRQGDVTDYRIAQLLDLKPQQISGYRNRGICPSNPVAMRLGELAGVDPLEAVASINFERASDPRDREVWAAMLARLSQAKKGRKTS